jgi:TetR/AcrR family transcriptional regulator, transcriptional repressor for nem operon
VITTSTRDTLLQAAERLVRSRGYAAFSYADLSEAVGIRKASIHHHFPSKADLGVALVDGYVQQFRDLLSDIERAEATAPARLARYARVYETSVRRGMLCLCGMLVTEVNVLPDVVRARVQVFFAEQLHWLARLLAAGQTRHEVALRGTPERAAEHVLSTLQGASLVAWGMGTPETVARAAEDLLASLRP